MRELTPSSGGIQMPRQERAARTRRALIRAAALVVAEQGYADASLGAVSARAGVSLGALHFHFASKQDLAWAVDEAAAQAVDRIAEEAAAASPDPLQQLVDSVFLLARGLLADPLLSAGFELGYSRYAVVPGAARDAWALQIAELTRRAHGAAGLGPGVTAGTAAETVLTLTAGLFVLGRTRAGRLADEHIATLLLALLPALAAPAALLRLRVSAPECNRPE
jgi:AcrR family transcriptional regulator